MIEHAFRDTVRVMTTPRRLTYLACPYSHPDREVRVQRFIAVNRVAGILMQLGHLVFSPISHTHPIAEECALPLGWEFWRDFDTAYLAASGMVVVLCIDGWRESVGVTAELEIARVMGLPVQFVDERGEALAIAS